MNVQKIERPSDESAARRAVVLIASHRNSQALKNFLNTGETCEVEMDVDTAYARLDIGERNVDDELVLVIYNSRISDDPSQMGILRNALTAIAKARNSRRINDFLNSGMISSNYSLSEWPVGLENIGNTCYLNSLLQFYFTIKPLRDLVLKIDDFKTPTDEASLNSKRVGSRNVSEKEVTRAQNCESVHSRLLVGTDSYSRRRITQALREYDCFLQGVCNTRARTCSSDPCELRQSGIYPSPLNTQSDPSVSWRDWRRAFVRPFRTSAP